MVSFSFFHIEIYGEGNTAKLVAKVKRCIRLEHFGIVYWAATTSIVSNALRNISRLERLAVLDIIGANQPMA